MEYMIYLCLPLDKVYPKIINTSNDYSYDITLTMENPKVIKMLNFLKKNISRMKNCLSILCLKIVNVYRRETEIKFYKYGTEREIMANLFTIKL